MTLLNCLCAAIPARERVISVEEVFELASVGSLRTSCGLAADFGVHSGQFHRVLPT